LKPLTRAFRDWFTGALVALAAALAIGIWPTQRLAPEAALPAVAAGCGIALAGALLGALPVLRAVARGDWGHPYGVVGWAMALRAGGTLAGALAVAYGSGLPRRTLVIWVAVAYGVLLVVETRWTARWLKAGRSSTET